MKFYRKTLAFLMVTCIGISMLCLLAAQASDHASEIENKDGLMIGSTIYDYDEDGNMTERIVDADGAVTLQQAKQDYYGDFIGGGDIDALAIEPYRLISIAADGSEKEISSFTNYQNALKAYDEIIAANPSVNYAVKSQDKYWKVKYAVVKFKKIISGGAISNISFVEDETNIEGYTNPSYALDAAFLESTSTQVKFRMGGVNGWVDASLVDIVPYADKITYVTYYSLTNGILYHRLRANDVTYDGSYPSSVNMGYAPEYLKPSTVYYSYDGHYFYTDYFKMIDDYRSDQTLNAVNASLPYYNYYQFLPLHSKTNYTAEDLNQLIASRYTEKPTSNNPSDLKSNQSLLVNEGASFMQGHDFGVNPLMTLGIAINESAWGRSQIAITKNNIFGLNAVDVNPSGSASVYVSVASCIEVFTKQWVTWGYLDTNDWRYYGGHLGDKSSGMNIQYASDPYWGEKAAQYCYLIDDYLGKKDYQKYTLGIKETPDPVNIRKKASTSSEIIYALKNPSSNVRNMPVIILENASGTSVNGNTLWYKIYTDHPLDAQQKKIARYNNEPLSWIYEQKYDFDQSYGFISSVYIQKINEAKQNEGNEPSFDVNTFLNKASLTLKNGYLYGITAETKIDTYISRLQALDDVKVEIIANGHENANQYIASDMQLKITSSSGATNLFTIVIKGDVNGDGKISSVDYVLVKNHILKINSLSGAVSLASDVNMDAKISSLDYVLIKNHILGLSQIK